MDRNVPAGRDASRGVDDDRFRVRASMVPPVQAIPEEWYVRDGQDDS